MNTSRFRSYCLTACAVVILSSVSATAQHGGYGAPPTTFALAQVDDKGMVTVREFYFGFPMGAPKKGETPISLTSTQPGKKPPMPAIHENRLVFKEKDVLVVNLDGKPIDAAVWRKALAKETPILYGNILFIPAKDEAPVKEQPAPKPPVLADAYKDVFKADTMILYAIGAPSEEGNSAAKGDAPKAPAPNVVQASHRDGKIVLLQKFEDEMLFPIKVKDKNKEGKDVESTIMVTEIVRGTRTREIPAKYTKGFDPGGKDLPADKLTSMLAKEKGVMESATYGNVDPFYLRLVRPDAVILGVPQPEVIYGGGEAVPPAK